MKSKEKKEADDFVKQLLIENGEWPCVDCSTENWQMWHRKDNLSCPKTGRLREECEDKTVFE